MSVVIIGGGHAGGQLAASLRQSKYDGSVTLIGSEKHLPYQRPPLTKEYLRGTFDLDRVHLRNQAFYESKEVQLALGIRVDEVDRQKQLVHLSDGQQVGYNHLVLATGSTPIELPIPGMQAEGVHLLRTIDDVDGIKNATTTPKTVAIIGGGYIGLEAAASLQLAGHTVHVFELEDRLLKRVATEEISEFFDHLHTERGVNLHLQTAVSTIETDSSNQACGVRFGDGESLSCDLVIVGVGIRPNVELAENTGLQVKNGIVVDDHCCTQDPHIFAIGDCTNHPNPLIGERLRLESVPNAMEQARVAAGNITGGDLVYASYPWFWSDQFELKLQNVGFPSERDESVTRGHVSEKQFAIFHLKQGKLIAADAVNSPRDFMAARQLIGKSVDARTLGDDSTNLKDLIRQSS